MANSNVNVATPLSPMGKMYHTAHTKPLIRSNAIKWTLPSWKLCEPSAAGSVRIRLLPTPYRPEQLLLHFHAPPEGHIPLDLASHRAGVGIVPGRVRVILPIDQQTHIASLAPDWIE